MPAQTTPAQTTNLFLLEDLEDTHEIVIRRGTAEPDPGLASAWFEARDEALEAFAWWAADGGRDAHAAYRAAEDRAQAARAALATFR